MHGGAKGSGGPRGERNGNFRHGRYAEENLARIRSVRKLVREVRALTKSVGTGTWAGRKGAAGWRCSVL